MNKFLKINVIPFLVFAILFIRMSVELKTGISDTIWLVFLSFSLFGLLIQFYFLNSRLNNKYIFYVVNIITFIFLLILMIIQIVKYYTNYYDYHIILLAFTLLGMLSQLYLFNKKIGG